MGTGSLAREGFCARERKLVAAASAIWGGKTGFKSIEITMIANSVARKEG